MSGWDGFGRRLREAMVEKGITNRKGDPDVTGFALRNGWIPNYVYRWLADESTPERPNLDKLADELLDRETVAARTRMTQRLAKAPPRPRRVP